MVVVSPKPAQQFQVLSTQTSSNYPQLHLQYVGKSTLHLPQAYYPITLLSPDGSLCMPTTHFEMLKFVSSTLPSCQFELWPICFVFSTETTVGWSTVEFMTD